LHLSGFEIVAILAISFQSFLLFLALFEPSLRYRVSKAPSSPLDSDMFQRILATLADSSLHKASKIDVFTNGENFYEAQLDAIRQAKRSVNLEAYIFQKGEVTRRFVEAMTERARNGVKVNIVLDAIGSFRNLEQLFQGIEGSRAAASSGITASNGTSGRG
jgi:cardiolipin synthase